jgi:hypothetical protein
MSFLSLLIQRTMKPTSPALLGAVKGIDDVECLWEFLFQHIKFLAEENIVLGDIGEDEFEFGLVGFVRECMDDELVKGRAATRFSWCQRKDKCWAHMPLPPPIKATSSNSLAKSQCQTNIQEHQNQPYIYRETWESAL